MFYLLQKTCKQLICPVFFVPVDSRCVQYLAGNMTYGFRVKLTLLERVNMTAAVKIDLKTQPDIIKKKLGFGNCKICKSNIVLIDASHETGLPEIMIDYALMTSESCKTEDILPTLTKVQHSPSDIRIMLNGTLIWVKVVWEEFKRYDGFVPLYREYFGTCDQIVMKAGTTCPRVKLSMYEYRTVYQRHPFAKELMFFPDEKNLNGTVYVCCQKYISGTLAIGMQSHMCLKISVMAFILSIAERSFPVTF